ncbi:PREDICTED: protein FAM192A-like [Chrysochloris asiatica]|uniref:Protein FAM192A-like n=1 Tax=Chrysochloris asiatica TaxID=185453 RepID=A0A9B0T2K6_CHRAS|nr:PREDICTED: protein FAM192A-like [Chrysochloris asiatica]
MINTWFTDCPITLTTSFPSSRQLYTCLDITKHFFLLKSSLIFQHKVSEKQRREEELKELKEYRSNLNKVGISPENKKEVEKKLAVKPVETKSKFSQAKLLAGAVKHKSSESGNSVKRLKPDPDPDDKNQEAASCVSLGSTSLSGPSIHCPSAAVCTGILPGLGAYSGSSDSESSSDSEGTINATGKIVSSIFRTNTFLEAP